MQQQRQSILFFVILLAAGSCAILIAQVPTRQEIENSQETQVSTDPAAVLAVVAENTILVGDFMPKVDARINEVLKGTDQEVPEDQLHYARVNLIRGLLVQAIQNKMMRESFLIDQVGTQAADKREEADEQLATRARQMFFETEMPELKKQYETEDINILDAKLREKGSSLAARQREFIDAMLGHLYIRSKVEREPDVPLAEIKEYYDSNRSEYERPERARWEQLTVLFSRFSGREDAYKAIWEMGREAYFGPNFAAVARAKSQDAFASSGGQHDWTPKGSLASQKLEEQIFSIPTGRLSEIIEDNQGFHIIRVLERNLADVIPMRDVQDDIRAELRKQKIAKSQREVMEGMKDRIPVWSLFHKDVPGAKPLPEKLASRHTDNGHR